MSHNILYVLSILRAEIFLVHFWVQNYYSGAGFSSFFTYFLLSFPCKIELCFINWGLKTNFKPQPLHGCTCGNEEWSLRCTFLLKCLLQILHSCGLLSSWTSRMCFLISFVEQYSFWHKLHFAGPWNNNHTFTNRKQQSKTWHKRNQVPKQYILWVSTPRKYPAQRICLL